MGLRLLQSKKSKMIIRVKVKPNSSIDKLEKLEDGGYVVYVKAPAVEGRANKRVVNLLAKEFNVNFRKIKIKNPVSKEKIVEIEK